MFLTTKLTPICQIFTFYLDKKYFYFLLSKKNFHENAIEKRVWENSTSPYKCCPIVLNMSFRFFTFFYFFAFAIFPIFYFCVHIKTFKTYPVFPHIFCSYFDKKNFCNIFSANLLSKQKRLTEIGRDKNLPCFFHFCYFLKKMGFFSFCLFLSLSFSLSKQINASLLIFFFIVN